METKELKSLATTLITVVGERQVKSLRRTSRDRLQGIFVNREGKDTPVKIVHIPEHGGVIRALVDTPMLGNYAFAEATVSRLRKYVADGTKAEDLDKPITTMSELVANIKAGKVRVDLHGHFAGQHSDSDFDFPPVTKRFLDKIVDEHQMNIDGAAGKFDGTWTPQKGKTMEETNSSMRTFYARMLDSTITHRYYRALKSSDDCTCSACGKRLELIVEDANTLSVAPGYFMREKGDYNIECEFPAGPPHATGEINVAGDLVFANFFPPLRADSPKDKQYSDEYGLSTYAGRRNITAWKAKNQNVAYGQMGNMSLSVWVNKEKDHVILTETWIESNKKIARLKSMGFKQVKYKGDDYISLGVWRWEATDVPTLETAAKEKLSAIVKEMKDDCKDIIVIEGAKHGVWEFTHYYDTTPDPEDEDELFIYAELKLKK